MLPLLGVVFDNREIGVLFLFHSVPAEMRVLLKNAMVFGWGH